MKFVNLCITVKIGFVQSYNLGVKLPKRLESEFQIK